MNILFYYEELYNTTTERLKALAGLSLQHKNNLLRQMKEHTPTFLTTSSDIETLARNAVASLGTMLCPEAAAEYAGMSKLLEMDMSESAE
ncbi:hypothetical protein [Chitinophaga rhizophila]|uniref:Uncharacterized protein n=1 Tax=Chitinophaga rhizophila TaxID=2866212 RepID=A0ABS7GL58_9BACT|nr:hypothetical protein [Chitinophaga rhizophila]MBW8687479.1 hypothetical protein [Chitinophaga rhizophila]